MIAGGPGGPPCRTVYNDQSNGPAPAGKETLPVVVGRGSAGKTARHPLQPCLFPI